MAIPTANYGISTYRTDTGSDLIVESVIGDVKVTLPAFVTEFSQTFDSNWNQEEVYGRVDPIATFQGTKRTISLSLSLPAGNLNEAKKHFEDCGKLTQMLYPGYLTVMTKEKTSSSKKTKAKKTKAKNNKKSRPPKVLGKVISKSPLVKVKFANLIKSSSGTGGLLGYFTSVTWNPQIDMGYFTSGKGNLFPKVINISFSFNVLHQHEVGFSSTGKPLNSKFPF